MCALIMKTKSIIELVEKIEGLIPSETSKISEGVQECSQKNTRRSSTPA